MTEVALQPFDVHQKIVSLKSNIALRLLELGGWLVYAKEKAIYRYFGCESWGEYLGQPEIAISRALDSKLRAVYTTLIAQHNLPQSELKSIELEKLYQITLLLRDRDHGQECSCQDLVADARVLSRSDLKQKVQELLGEAPRRQEKEKEIVCPNCGASFSLEDVL